eukprot:21920_1
MSSSLINNFTLDFCKVGQIKYEFHYSLVALLVFASVDVVFQGQGGIVTGVSIVQRVFAVPFVLALMLLSVLVAEVLTTVTTRGSSDSASRIILWPGGGMASPRPKNVGAALTGPIFSIALAIGCGFLYKYLMGTSRYFALCFMIICVFNATLAYFNLFLPVFPLTMSGFAASFLKDRQPLVNVARILMLWTLVALCAGIAVSVVFKFYGLSMFMGLWAFYEIARIGSFLKNEKLQEHPLFM